MVARNIAGIIQAIHDEGYVLGDIKLQNILVNNRALPTIIDTDSFQVVDPIQNKVYRCLVASEGFTPSELIGKDIDSITQSAIHDRFRLGVVIYYLLFGGPPFRGSWQGSGDPPEQVELIRRGFWPYAPNSLIQPNHNTIPLDIIHPELQRCFLLCFNDGHFNPSKRPSARVWLEALEVAFNELQSCGKIDSHFYGLSYGRCYWCDRAQNLGVDIFQGKSMVKPQPLKPLSSTSTKPLPIVVKPIVPNPPITYQPSQLFLTRRRILVGMGLVTTGAVITKIGLNKTSVPTPKATSIIRPLANYIEILLGNTKLEMVKIPAGSFTMGSDEDDSEKPKHQVTLQEFYLGKYPVTQEQYQAIMGENPSYFRGNSKKPVECVSWQDAQEFCQKLTQKTGKKYRLPSEAEWEYACRADSQTRYYFGDDASQLKGYAWFGDNSGKLILDTTEIWSKDQDNYFNRIRDNDCKTHPVGQKKPNKWGLYDMSGNLWEWCEDVWHRNYENAPKDGSAWNKDSQINEKIIRGGSWLYLPWYCRSASRDYYSPDSRLYFIGFRVVCAVRVRSPSPSL